MIWTGLPVVSCAYMPAAEMPMPCCPRLMRSRWNFDPYRSLAKIGGICWRTMPGPLSATVMRKRVAWLGDGGAPPLEPLLAATSTLTTTSGRIPASSQASSALSTASLTQVRSALRGLSNPRRWRFLVKNSETEISRWRAPISAADTAAFGSGVGGLARAVVISLFDTRPALAITLLYRPRARGSSAGSPADALAVDGDAHEDERHLVGRALAPAHGARGFARLALALRGVVEHGDHVDARAARQGDGFRERVVRLPVKVPVVDVNQRAHAPVRVRRGHLHVASEQVHMRRDAGRVHVPARGYGPRRADFVPLLARGNREGVVQDRDGSVALVDRALGEVQRGLRAVRASLR